MTNYDWDRAFGEAPAPFETRVRQTVARLQAAPRRAARPRLALVLAALLVLLAGTALALGSLGVLDTLHETLRQFLRPEAEGLVRTGIVQTAEQPRHATCTVEQALNDGHQIYATVRVHADEGVLLMDIDAEPSMSVEHWRGYDYQYEGQTFSNRAYTTDRLLVQADCDPVDGDGNSLNSSVPEIAYDGEDILYTVTYPADAPGASLRLSTFEVFSDDKPHSERLSFGALTLEAPLTDARSLYTAELPVALPIGKLRLTELTVEQTPIATYVTCAYGPAADADDLTLLHLQDGIWAEWLDEHGEPVPEGMKGNVLRDGEGDTTRLTTVYRAFETLPGSLTLRFRNGMMNETYDTVAIPLRPVDTVGTKEEAK